MYWWGPFVALFFFCLMEFIAWFSHKYVMHKFLWFLHEDHHVVKSGFFERNDFFFIIFALPSWLGIMLGMMYDRYFFVWMGYGIAVYGFAYFMMHEVYIHRRFKWLRDIDHPYFIAIRKAHKVHHKHLDKKDGECFGMLIVPRKYYLEAKEVFKRKKERV